MTREDAQPITAGVVAALVGFIGSFSVVLAGLRAVGADHAEATSGLAVLSISMGLTAIVLAWRTRMPLSIAWSTPGAALLIGAGPIHGGYAAALGAFVVSGALVVVAGLSRRLEQAISAIPGPLASALLAGILLPVCLAPVRSVVAYPWLTGPAVIVWLVLTRTARRLAVVGALLAAGVALVLSGRVGKSAFAHPLPTFTAVVPHLDLQTIASLSIPLFLVTMVSQNLAGVTVLRLHGYRPRLRPVLTSTGAISALIAPFGGHAINLAAITAALMAGPDGGPKPQRRWIAAVACGVVYLVLGAGAALVTGVAASAPPVLIEAVAGLALLGSLGGALQAATADVKLRDPALVTLVTTASGITAAGLAAPFWGLVAGLAMLTVQRFRLRSAAASEG